MDGSRLDLRSCTIIYKWGRGVISDVSHEMKKENNLRIHIRCVLEVVAYWRK